MVDSIWSGHVSVLDLMGVVPRDNEAGSGFRHGGPPHASRVVGHLWP
jgi:hypothetical protein